MMNGIRALLPIILLFFVLLITIILCKSWLESIGVSTTVMRGGNLILAILTMITVAIQHRALYNANPNVFVRSVMSTMLIKMLVMALAVIIYAQATSGHLNSKGIFGVMILYLLYLAVEVYTVMKLNRKKDG